MRKLLFVIFSIFIFAQIACATDYFALGKEAFSKKDYQNANVYFVKALTANPNDATGRYYYAQTLTYLRNYKQAKIEYGYVIQLAPDSLAAKYSQQSIDYLNTIETAQGGNENKEIPNDNYLTKAISEKGDLETWDKDKMPIKVYFDNSLRVKSDYVVEAKNALTAWETAGAGIVKFQIVPAANQADVRVVFQGMDKTVAGSDVLGHATPHSKDGYIESCDIVLYTITPKYQHLTNTDLYNVALHEYGHMLGIAGHSENQSDALHPTANILSTNIPRQTLTTRDINTLKALYSIDKNPYGTGANSINRILGSKEDRLNTTLQNNLDYVKQLPNSSNGYFGVANVYKEMGKSDEAIQYYKKAIELNHNDTKAMNNLANIYADKQDIKNAEFYYKKAIQNDPKNIQYNKNLIILYMKNNKTSNARSALTALLYRNYKAREDADIKKFMEQLNK